MKILALDISTKTGWSVFQIINNKYELLHYGQCTKRSEPHDQYPKNYLEWAADCAQDIEDLIVKYQPNHLIIEETSKGSKNNFSQKILEFIHCFVAMYITKIKISSTYYRTEEWRRICGCVMTNEEKRNNSKRSKRKTKLQQNGEDASVIKDTEGKRLGRITKKHVNVRRANEIFKLNLLLKNEDTADSLLLGYAYYIENFKKGVINV